MKAVLLQGNRVHDATVNFDRYKVLYSCPLWDI